MFEDRVRIKHNTGKKVKIDENMRKHTLSIIERIKDSIRQSWKENLEFDEAADRIADILVSYSKKEGKEAVEIILDDDLDIFKDEKKSFRVYAYGVLKGGKKKSKKRIKKSREHAQMVFESAMKFEADIKEPPKPHPFGTGLNRLKNELHHRPRFLKDDLMFKMKKAMGIY